MKVYLHISNSCYRYDKPVRTQFPKKPVLCNIKNISIYQSFPFLEHGLCNVSLSAWCNGKISPSKKSDFPAQNCDKTQGSSMDNSILPDEIFRIIRIIQPKNKIKFNNSPLGMAVLKSSMSHMYYSGWNVRLSSTYNN